jgi:alanine racemase
VASSRLEIDLGSIERNLGVVRRTITPPPPAENSTSHQHRPAICAVLKQDGYGAGAVRIAKRLIASGVEMLAVYALDEARALAEAIPTVPILILMPIRGLERHDPLYRHAIAGRLHFTVHSLDQFAAIQETAARLGTQVPVHLQADTGLSRAGAMVGEGNEAVLLLQRIVASPKVRLAGLMTHFASPCGDDEFTREQARLFRDFIESIRPIVKAAVDQGGRAVSRMNELVVHAANSCATFRSRSYHGTMVRVGQCMLGYVGADVHEREHFEFRNEMDSLEPAVRWIAPIAHIQEIPVGWPVGYGSTWKAPQRADGRATRIALIPVGYADGLPRTLGGRSQPSGGGPGCVGFTSRAYEDSTQTGGLTIAPTSRETVYAPIVGRVSMDQITVDVTDVPDAYLRIARPGLAANSASGDNRGTEVEIYSRHPEARTFLPRAAETAGTITHDLLCRISPRVERVYKVSAALEPIAEPTRAAPAPLPMPVMMPTLTGAAAVA